MRNWVLRDEQPADVEAIATLTTAAFAGRPYSSGTEAAIVDALRAADALTISLVAADAEDGVIGHVAFSPATIGGDASGWFALGPVSVDPQCQGEGIGTALVTAGLERLRNAGAKGCILLGAAAYYRRFGFEHDLSVTLEGLPPGHLMVQWFGAERATGEARFHPAFGV
ncbi:N-acetyltransferase [Mesorhizobium sp. BR1-1-16]|uniref:GNAT family N-acetyltransferase n=1 Tax=Mesorhizobium sp. BR1-1-16 TaxID=2876653 RepID=UPI001CC9FD87|nr:N-acetyltransferase [Mesorhizobium sp. BR1-1-16]MBZ9935346.1 N-acetyltransferase [Mesorhizobium sp. BR1-1-16]